MGKEFLVALVVSVLLAFLPITLAHESSDDSASRTFTIKPAVPRTITENVLSSAGTAVYEIRLDVTRTVVNAGVYLSSIGETDVPSVPGGIVFDYFGFRGEKLEPSDIDSLIFRFRVGKSWIGQNQIQPGSIKLLALRSGEWSEVPLRNISETVEEMSYEAEISGPFDVREQVAFAIVGEGPPVEVPDVVEVENETEVVEVVSGGAEEERSSPATPNGKSDDSVPVIVAVVLVAIIVAAVLLIPGSFVRKGFGKAPKKSSA